MPEVVSAGEAMLLLTPALPERLRHATDLRLKMAGAESNVAIALSRLGITAGWVGCLGEDEPGRFVLDRIRAEGVDTSRVTWSSERPTGLFLREMIRGRARVYYYRQGSAASAMGPGSIDAGYLKAARFVHLSGITPALSQECAAFVSQTAREARGARVRVSFDINYRSKLWSAEEARTSAEGLLPKVDLLFVGDEEAQALWGRSDEGLLHVLSEMGPQEVILKRGKEGSRALVGSTVFNTPSFFADEVDPIGAGDAFDAGYLAASLWGMPPSERLRVGNAMGSMSVATLGDYEGLPDLEELQAFLEGHESLGR